MRAWHALRLWRPGEDRVGRGLAASDGAVHVHVTDAGDVGAGPVDRADRPPQVDAEAREAADAERGRVGAARPLLGRPVELVEPRRRARLRADVGGEAVEDRGTPVFGAEACGALRVLTGEERQQDAGLSARRRVVVQLADEQRRSEALAREPVLAPERVVVD